MRRNKSTFLLRSSVRSWCDGSSDRPLMVDLFNYFLFQPVFRAWCNKGHGMCYPVCGMVHIKEPMLLIGKSSPCGGSGFPLSLSEWSFTIWASAPAGYPSGRLPYCWCQMCWVRHQIKHFLQSILICHLQVTNYYHREFSYMRRLPRTLCLYLKLM